MNQAGRALTRRVAICASQRSTERSRRSQRFAIAFFRPYTMPATTFSRGLLILRLHDFEQCPTPAMVMMGL